MGYLDVAESKRQQRQQRIPPEWLLKQELLQAEDVLAVPRQCGVLTDRELEITEQHDAVGVVRCIAKGTYSAKEVAVAFCKRAAIAQQLVRPLRLSLADQLLILSDKLPYRDFLPRRNSTR